MAAYLDVGGHDITLAQMQDYDLMLRLALGRPDPVITPAHLVDYHQMRLCAELGNHALLSA